MKDSPNALHTYKPRTHQDQTALDNLALYTVPASIPRAAISKELTAELSLFAGQLYMSSYADYLDICQFLGISSCRPTREMGEMERDFLTALANTPVFRC